jgi:hypothetical protein
MRIWAPDRGLAGGCGVAAIGGSLQQADVRDDSRLIYTRRGV